MSRYLLIICTVFFFTRGAGQNCPIDSPIGIPFSDTVKYELEVFDVVNDDLAHPDQAVCSIAIDFDCNEVAGLEIWLVSPAGDTVQLAGPVVNTGMIGTLGSNWDITFLNDSIYPDAEADFPYADYFDHQVNTFSGGNYTGSYFPFRGSLQDFKRGPVNGSWQLILHLSPNFILVEGSQVNNIHLNFCDRRGYFCCFAEAGNLTNTAPLTACPGDSILANINPDPFFASGPADSSSYAYTYLISRSDTIVAYDSLPDLRHLPPGSYQLHGFSYQSNQRDSFPDAGALLSQLRDTLLSDLPPFCGRITPNNTPITILAPPDTTRLGQQIICEGDSLLVAGKVLTEAGAYWIDTPAANGCDSIIQLELLVQAPSRDTLIETSCVAGSFLSSTGITLDSSGFYPVYFTSANGCDSIIVVDFRNYSIQNIISASATTLSCRDSVVLLDGSASNTELGDFSYRWEAPPFGQIISTDPVIAIDQPGKYTLQLQHETGCPPVQRSITIADDRQAPEVIIPDPPLLNCADSLIQISAQLINSTGNPYSYQWSNNNGTIQEGSDSLFLWTNQGGSYQLIVTDTINGCQDTAQTVVSADTLAPIFSLPVSDTITCEQPVLNPTLFLLAPPGDYQYEWLDSQGQTIPGGQTTSPTITQADQFLVRVTNLDNGCSTQQVFISQVDTLRPIPSIADPGLLNCQIRELTLQTNVLQAAPRQEIDWQTAQGGQIIAGANTLNPTINAGGDYLLTITNPDNGCIGQTQISIQDSITQLNAQILQEDLLTCQQQSTRLSSSGSSTGPNIQYLWNDLDHGTFSNQAGSSINIQHPGRYQLVVKDVFTQCVEVNTWVTRIDTLAPEVRTGLPAQIDCRHPQVTLGDAASAQNSNLIYTWQGPCLLSRPDSIQVQTDCPGSYTLSVLNTTNGCQASAVVTVNIDTTTPMAIIPDTILLNCRTGLALLDGSAASGGQLEWYFGGALLASNTDSLLVPQPGTYTLLVNNTELQCTDEKDIFVLSDCRPTAQITRTDTLNCENTVVLLDAGNSLGEALVYQWSGPGQEGCFQGADSSAAQVNISCPGTYQVIVTNQVMAESDTAEVLVIQDTDLPLADAGPDIDLSCQQPMVNREAVLTGNPPGTMYRWRNSAGTLLSSTSSFVFQTGGTYILEVEHPLNNCLRYDTLQVNDPVVPDFDLPIPDTLNCRNAAVQLRPVVLTDTAVLHYQWVGPAAGIIDDAEQASITVGEPGVYQLTLTDTLNQCSFTDSVQVMLDRTPPQVNAGKDSSLNCLPSGLRLNASVSPVTPFLEYHWIATSPTGILSGANSLQPQVQDTGWYQLTVLDSGNGCTATDSLWVSPAAALPDLSSLQDSSLNCMRTSLNLLAPVSQAEDYTLRWTGSSEDGLPVDTVTGPVFLAKAPGSYTLYIQDPQSACSSSQTILVSNDTLAPAFSLSTPDTLNCLRNEVLLATKAPIDTTRYSLQWSSSSTVVEKQQLPLSVTSAGTYSLQIQDRNNGCTQQQSVQVIAEITPPALSLQPAASLNCRQDTITLTMDAPTEVRIDWRGPAGGLIGDTHTRQVLARLPGWYQVHITDPANGCATTDSIELIEDKIPPYLELDTTALVIGCVQTSLTLDASPTVTASGLPPTYWWTSNTGSSEQPLLEVTTAQSVQLQVSDPQNGCSATYLFLVEQDQEQPRFDLQADGFLGCGKNTVTLDAVFEQALASIQLNWSVDGQMLDDSSSSISVQDTGTYQLISTNLINGCSFTQQVAVAMNPAIPQLTVKVDTSLECEIDQVKLEVQVANYPANDLTYRWSTTDGRIVGQTDATAIWASEQGNYQVHALHPSDGCEGLASGTVIRNGRSIKALDFSIYLNACDPAGGGQLSVDEIKGGDGPYLYDFSERGLQADQPLVFARAGTYTLVVEDINGCRLDTLVDVVAEKFPLVHLGNDLDLVAGDSIQLDVQIDSGPYATLEWLNQQVVIATDRQAIVVSPAQSTVYTVRATTTAGCVFEDRAWVFVAKAPVAYFPSAFSPNGDGTNDQFRPGFNQQVSRVKQFNIYDRWGNVMHSIQDVHPDDAILAWDGYYQNQPATGSVYIYWLEVVLESGEQKQLKGTFTLVR